MVGFLYTCERESYDQDSVKFRGLRQLREIVPIFCMYCAILCYTGWECRMVSAWILDSVMNV